MTKHTSWAIALTATTFLSAPAIAASLTPTLDALKSEAGSVLPSISETYTLTELSGNLPEGAVKVEIDDKNYYFTPSGDNAGLLTTLAGTSAGMLKEDANGLFEVDGVKYAFDVAAIPSSAFSYLEGSESDYNFTLQEADADGKLTTKYYKINLKPEQFATSKSISWAEVGEDQKDAADVVEVKLPNDQSKYFKYTYIQPENYTETNTRINNTLSPDRVTNVVFKNISSSNGGAIYNTQDHGDINIVADFIGNNGDSRGGAIYNSENAAIGNISGDFIGNYASSNSGIAYGGAIDNRGTIGDISGDFIGNHASSSGSYANGGAIYNIGIIGNTATIGNINGDFVGNYVSGKDAYGGAIFNSIGNIGNISGDFIGNYASGSSASTPGGAIYNTSTIGNISGDFIGNYASGSNAYGGAIFNIGTIGNISGDFIGNYVSGGNAYGGAIYNTGTIGNISGDFIGNYAQNTSDTRLAQGGAVHTNKAMTFTSGSETHFMSGNYTKDKRGKIYNAVYGVNAPVITFNTTGGGAWVINDNMEGGKYSFTGNDTIDTDTGTTTQYVAINNNIINAAEVTVSGTTLRFGAYQHEDQTAKNWNGKGTFVASLNEDGTANHDAAAVTSLSLNNAVFDIANGYQDIVKLKGYSATDSFLHIDVDVDNMKADELHIAGNVEGVTKMIVHASSDADIRNRGQILFAQSENDTTGNAGSFVVSRVYKSPYLFDVKYDQIAENSNKWSLEMNDKPNEVPDVPTPSVDYRKVAPEVIAYQGLPVAAIEQTKGMVGNISRQVQGNRFYCPGCGFYDSYWNGQAFNALWANAVYQTSENEALVNVDADVWGIEAGGDLQHDLNNKLGLFLSYRKGNYDMNGKGKHYYSTIGSEIDIDSYLAGLYYRYDRNNWWGFATVYGGMQKADLKTKDGIKSDTDGTQFGGSVELGYDYALTNTVYLTPSLGAFYNQLNYGDATDNAGKTAEYDLLRQLELEAGVKLTKAFIADEGYANVYVKPSVVQTLNNGDDVKVTGLRKINTLEDQTLGRIELGGRYGFTEQLSAYGWANHTFGDDYKASTFGLGLSYSW